MPNQHTAKCECELCVTWKASHPFITHFGMIGFFAQCFANTEQYYMTRTDWPSREVLRRRFGRAKRPMTFQEAIADVYTVVVYGGPNYTLPEPPPNFVAPTLLLMCDESSWNQHFRARIDKYRERENNRKWIDALIHMHFPAQLTYLPRLDLKWEGA